MLKISETFVFPLTHLNILPRVFIDLALPEKKLKRLKFNRVRDEDCVVLQTARYSDEVSRTITTRVRDVLPGFELSPALLHRFCKITFTT